MISGGSIVGSQYILSSGGVAIGRSLPRWPVQQVTTCRPLKLSRLMAATICIMRRAVRFFGGSSSHFGFDVPAPVWQSPQQTVRAAENNPMVPMNSSTGIPFKTWTFLKTWSDIWTAGCGACPATRATLAAQTMTAAATAVVGRIHLYKDVMDSL